MKLARILEADEPSGAFGLEYENTRGQKNTMFLEASVLMNVKADEYVAVFGVLQEGATVVECNQKMDAVTAE